MSLLKEPISTLVWDIKYRYRRYGQLIDQTIEDTWHRVAAAIARPEHKAVRPFWEAEFYNLLANFLFLPGGRILAGAGTKNRVTLFNCFVMDIKEDSLPAIFNALAEGALTLQQGGGVGYDFSILRPQGDEVKKTGLAAAGPVNFMRIWDTTCSILLSTGARRGAMMGVLRCDHPDIETFIAAKADPQQLRHFNVSVLVSDAFMQAVADDAPWALCFPLQPGEGEQAEIIYRDAVPHRVYRYVRARSLWDKIIRSAYDYAEPGVLFGDTINRMNNLWYSEHIHATNPCGEIPLPAYGACNLGSINLTQFVSSPYTHQAAVNFAQLEKVTQIATRFLDNVVDVSRYPLKAQATAASNTRRIGLGVTGLADLMVMLGLRYGSPDSIKVAEQLMQCIMRATWYTSIQLAEEKGAFPLFCEDYLRGAFVNTLPEDIRQDMARYGVRNSHHNTIAPAGTISLLANNVSNGIEPIYQAEYNRHMREASGNTVKVTVKDYAYAYWQREHSSNLPPAWMDTTTLTPAAHLAVQGAMQAYIDNAISKTINIPSDYPFEKLSEIYTEAYRLGLKGCTIFRPNAVTGSVLTAKECEITEVGNCCPE